VRAANPVPVAVREAPFGPEFAESERFDVIENDDVAENDPPRTVSV
jgi:hypothetical protein